MKVILGVMIETNFRITTRTTRTETNLFMLHKLLKKRDRTVTLDATLTMIKLRLAQEKVQGDR